MIKIQEIFLTKNDLKKIATRGCTVCRNTNFSCYKIKQTAVCNGCGTSYHIVGEGALDCLAKTSNEIEIYRSSSLDYPRENFKVRTRKISHTLKEYESNK